MANRKRVRSCKNRRPALQVSFVLIVSVAGVLIAQGLKGETVSSGMTLVMKTWHWEKTAYSDGRSITPKQPDRFALTFSSDGHFSATTDCNNMNGVYTAANSAIAFGQIASTRMYCEGSQETDFSSTLEDARRYHFDSKGDLILDLKSDTGSAVFR